MNPVAAILSAAEIATVSQLLGRVHASFKDDLKDDKLNGYFSDLAVRADGLIVAIKKSTAPLNMDEADSKRDTTIRNFFTVVEASLVSLVDGEAEEGKKVLEIMNKYGRKITGEKLLTESAHIESMLKDLSTAEMQSALAKIHCGKEYFAQLTADEEAFKALQVQNNSASQEVSGAKSATVLKKELREFLNSTVLPYINAMTTIDADKYSRFSAEISREVRSANENARKALNAAKALAETPKFKS